MHKARENSNGSFSIGKTWTLDDLAAVESYTGATPSNLEEQQQIAWAGNLGFMVIIQKPYYWQAATAKEKDFFIGSLVKIFRKYTGGRIPQLSGFTPQELAEFTAPPGPRPKTPSSVSPALRPPPAPLPNKQPSSEYPQAPQRASNRTPNRELRPQPSNEATPSRPGTQENGPVFEGQLPTSDFVRSLKPQDSRSRFQADRSESPATGPIQNGSTGPPSPEDDRSLRSTTGKSVESFHSRRDLPQETPSGSSQPAERARANGAYSPLPPGHIPPQPAPRSPERPVPTALKVGTPPRSQLRQEPLPERKRPPIDIPKFSQKTTGVDSPQEFLTPSEVTAPQRSQERLQLHASESAKQEQDSQPLKEYFPRILEPPTILKNDSPSEPPPQEGPTAPPPTNNGSPDVKRDPIFSPSTPMSPPETPPIQDEVHRPGLGPMIKKKSQKEIASVFRKAAAAHNAFKPRPGGAAEKIKDEMIKSPNTPDGINGVFPAPSLVRDLSNDGIRSPLPLLTPTTTTKPSDSSTTVPGVKITPSPSTITTPSEPKPGAVALDVPHQPSPSPERKAGAQEERRKKRPSNHSAIYAKALGIDPTLLEGRTLELESALSDFGWTEGETLRKSYDELQVDIRRDLAKIETGSWLGNFDHNDDRVTLVSKMLDKAIAECEELDGLLTLYNVELGVCSLYSCPSLTLC